jgi:hypothetical protein
MWFHHLPKINLYYSWGYKLFPELYADILDKAQNLIVSKYQPYLCCYISIYGHIHLGPHYIFFCLFCDCDSWMALLNNVVNIQIP